MCVRFHARARVHSLVALRGYFAVPVTFSLALAFPEDARDIVSVNEKCMSVYRFP